HHLTVVESNAVRRIVVLSGTVDAISVAFGVQLQKYEYQGVIYRGRTGEILIPAELASIVTGIFGIDNRPQARAHIQFQAAAAKLSYNPLQLAQLYNFPTGSDGSGQCIAII